MDSDQRTAVPRHPVRPEAVYSLKPHPLVHRRVSGADHHDEPEPAGRAGQARGDHRLCDQLQGRAGDRRHAEAPAQDGGGVEGDEGDIEE